MSDSLSQRPHRRRNALTGEWVTVSPQRTQRPWQGEKSLAADSIGVIYDPDCYLCPGNTRVGGHVNAPYKAPWAFDNDFPAVATRCTTLLGCMIYYSMYYDYRNAISPPGIPCLQF